ncbi:recombinase family protein [Rhizobium leguminosarum]|uniref:recombinase family protein n=1 Tax=Rhizobium leguminosarum TaxID=384 RepID=UPI0032AEE41A
MVIDWSQRGGEAPSPQAKAIPVATYVRMSTEHQKYSTDNQIVALRQYAEKNGFETFGNMRMKVRAA